MHSAATKAYQQPLMLCRCGEAHVAKPVWRKFQHCIDFCLVWYFTSMQRNLEPTLQKHAACVCTTLGPAVLPTSRHQPAVAAPNF